MRSPPRPRKSQRGDAVADEALTGPAYRFYGGKGGAGKTTCAAAAALVLAETGRRVLAVSTDPAHSLGDALAARLGPGPRRVATRRGRLWAAELDADRALARWLDQRRAALGMIARRGTYLDDEDIERLLRLSLPGVDELIGLIELTRVAAAGRYHEVVVDTAPTGHTLRLLAMPETVRRVAAILDHMYAKHRFMAERLGGVYRPDASDALIEEIDAQGRELGALLRDGRRASFSWLLLPETLSVEEARDGLRELVRSGLCVRELIVNRLTPPPDGRCRLCRARVRAERDAVRAIRAAFPGRVLRFLPAVEVEPRGLPALRAIGRRLAGPDRGLALVTGRAPRVTARSPEAPDRDADRKWLEVLAPGPVRLLLFVGKGGVGKTTCAATAALALAAQAPARRILLLSTDPAHSLADVLATRLADDARPLPGAPRALRARELDAHRAFRRRRDRYRRAADELFDAVRRGSTFDATFDRAVVRDLIDLAPPGVDELFAVLSVTEALFPRGPRPAAYDVVVVDTAPTGHTLRLLALPGAALEWVRALLAILLKYRQVISLGTLARDLVEMSRELRQLDALLRDGRATRVVAVTHAAEMPRLETARLLARLGQLGIGVPALVVNAVTPSADARCRRCARAAAAEARQIEAVRAPRRALILAPAVAPPPRGVDALGRWGRAWTIAA